MIKLIALVTRKEGLAREEFVRIWRDEHTKLVAALPGLRGYTQNVALGTREWPVDGVVELWFDDMDASDTDEGRAVRTHEATFVGSVETVPVAERTVVEVTTDRARDRALREIQELCRRYAETIDAGRFDEFAALFAHGLWRGIPGSEIEGWLTDRIRVFEDGTPRTAHLTSELAIDVQGLRATGRCVVTILQQPDPQGPIKFLTVNDCVDEFELAGDAWRFVRRDPNPRLRADMSTHQRVPTPTPGA